MKIFIYIFFVLTLPSCATLAPCTMYDSIEFCNQKLVKTDSIIKELKNNFTADKNYKENKKYKLKWNNKIKYVYTRLMMDSDRKKQKDKYKKILTITRNNNKNNYKIYDLLGNSEKKMILFGLEYYKKLNPKATKKDIYSFILRAGYGRQVEFEKYVKNNIDYLSDYFYVRQSAEILRDEIISVYHDNNRLVFLSRKKTSPKIDHLGNLYLSENIKNNEIDLIMTHEAIHMSIIGFNKLINKYIIKSLGSKKFLKKNILSILDPLGEKYIQNMDAYLNIHYGEASTYNNFRKEIFIDLKVLDFLSNDYNKCLSYLNLLKTNIIHDTEVMRTIFIKKSCNLIKNKKYNSSEILEVYALILKEIKNINSPEKNKNKISQEVKISLDKIKNESIKDLGFILVLSVFYENIELQKRQNMSIYGSNYFKEIYKRYKEMKNE